jgi:hypothetical protein
MALPPIKEPPMQIDGRVMAPDAFVRHVEGLSWPAPTATRIFLHHTWRPTVESWQGAATMRAMKAYYEKQLWRDEEGTVHEGWTAGPHVFVAPDGIWLFSDLRYDGVGVYGNNHRTRHIEMVGDYDQVRPSGRILDATILVLGSLVCALGLDPGRVAFHRDYSTKSCPGWSVSKQWILPQVAAWIADYGRSREEKRRSPREAITQAILGMLKPHDSQRALPTEGRRRGLLGPISDEMTIEIAGEAYVAQVFAEALLVRSGGGGDPQNLADLEKGLDSERPDPAPAPGIPLPFPIRMSPPSGPSSQVETQGGRASIARE